MNNRAYSVLTIKSVDDDQRVITGMATTPSTDRIGDIIEPEGAEYENPTPFLWQHNHDMPVGHTRFGKATKQGIPFETKFVHPDAVKSETLKDRLQMAWDSIKTKLVRAVSIGFRPIEYSFMDNGGIRYSSIEIYELSAVTIPANSEALITTIKALDAEFRHAEGVADPEIPEEPKDEGATAKIAPVVKLDPARDRAPFVINKIHPARPAGR
jgi:HK97 family phage prohead protease